MICKTKSALYVALYKFWICSDTHIITNYYLLLYWPMGWPVFSSFFSLSPFCCCLSVFIVTVQILVQRINSFTGLLWPTPNMCEVSKTNSPSPSICLHFECLEIYISISPQSNHFNACKFRITIHLCYSCEHFVTDQIRRKLEINTEVSISNKQTSTTKKQK